MEKEHKRHNLLFHKMVVISRIFSPNDNLDTLNTLKAETT